MLFLRTSLVTLALASTLFAGCKLPQTNKSDQARGSLPGVQANPPAMVSTYFIARRDTRRCAFPTCGGVFVAAVNQAVTRCARGSYAKECYVPTLDYSSFEASVDAEPLVKGGLDINYETTRVVLLGTLQPTIQGLGTMRVQMAWIATEPHQITGEFFSAHVNGIVCIAAPCPSYDQELLNRGRVQPFHGFDLDAVPEHASDGTYTNPALQSNEGLVVAGENVIEEAAGPAGQGTFLKASQVFIPASVLGRNVAPVDEPPQPSREE